MVGFNRRFDPNFALIKRVLLQGRLARLSCCLSRHLIRHRRRSLTSSLAGLFRDMMIHDFDMANFIMGEAPVSISATGSCQG